MTDSPAFGDRDGKIEVDLALRAYQTVVDRGERQGDGYEFEGLTASTDFDGYTVQLTDGTTTLRIFFHNRFSVEPKSARLIKRFWSRVKRVAAL